MFEEYKGKDFEREISKRASFLEKEEGMMGQRKVVEYIKNCVEILFVDKSSGCF